MEYTSPQHVAPDEVKDYLVYLSDPARKKELEVHKLAIELLGSSYFVEYSKGYLEWVSKYSKRMC